MHLVFRKILDANGLKGPRADVKRDILDVDPLGRKPAEKILKPAVGTAPAGEDEILRRVQDGLAQEIRITLRASDILCRWGGEEFVAVLADCDGLACAAIGNKIREAVAAMQFEVNGVHFSVTLSAGAAEYHDNEASLVMNRADKALYRAKGEGRNRVVLAT